MGRVIGLGGVFYKSKDPKKLQEWYTEHLDLPTDHEGFIIFKWKPAEETGRAAYSIWALFPEDTEYMEPSTSRFMVNFCVDGIEEIHQSLKEKGVDVHDKIEETPQGRFTWFMDPEGNRIELWEPPKLDD